MYIWILLATIMISLSFFNLSPRADKETVFSEVKATSLVTRFKAEHTAFNRIAECRLINSVAGDPYFKHFVLLGNTQEASDNSAIFEKNLPLGYQKGNDLTVYHYTYCLDADIGKGGSPNLRPCDYADRKVYRYAVSFAAIPPRWLSKDTDGAPIPTLSNAVSKLYIKGSLLGITHCTGEDNISSCSFQGTDSYVKELNTAGSTSGTGAVQKVRTGFLSFDGSSGFYKNLFEENEHFKENCVGSCFFSIHRLSNKDIDNHCQALGYN